MFPATNQYPRPILALLRKRNRQTNRIMFVSVSAKNLGYGHRQLKAVKRGGKPTTIPDPNQTSQPPALGSRLGWANAPHYVRVVAKKNREQSNNTFQPPPPSVQHNPEANTPQTPTTTKHATHQKSENPYAR